MGFFVLFFLFFASERLFLSLFLSEVWRGRGRRPGLEEGKRNGTQFRHSGDERIARTVRKTTTGVRNKSALGLVDDPVFTHRFVSRGWGRAPKSERFFADRLVLMEGSPAGFDIDIENKRE